MRWFHSQRVLGAQFGNGLRFFCADFQAVVYLYLLKYVKIVAGIVFVCIFVPIKQTQTMTTTDLKNAITNQKELEVIAKQIWFMNFTRLIRQGFSIDFATEQATRNSERQIKLITN